MKKQKKKSAEFCIRLGWVGAVLRYSLLHTHTQFTYEPTRKHTHMNQNRIQIMFFDTWTHKKENNH